MEEFLKKLQLSNHAIEIFLKSLGRSPFTYYELASLVPTASPEEFEESLGQLVNGGLLIELIPKNQEILLHYLAIPPILPIINYYENINENLKGIKDSIRELMVDTLNKTFQQNNVIELDTILQSLQETRKDIDEDVIIQKQEVEDIVKGMEELKNLKQNISELSQQIKVLTQTQFANLMKKISQINSTVAEEINALDFKKHKQEILAIVKQSSKEKLNKMVQEFSRQLHEVIDEKFESTTKPIEQLIDNTIQYRDDFKLILLNMLTSFETKMNTIYELIKSNKAVLSLEMKNLENKIAENLNVLIQNSIDQVSGLSKPVENLMKNYFQEMSTSDRLAITDVWFINSLTKINEEIQKFITTSKEELIIIIPRLDQHLAIEQFDSIPRALKIRVVSSEPHTNSSVKKFKDISNLIYRTLENQNLILLKGDTNQIALGIIQHDSKDPSRNFVGIGSNFKPLIELLTPIFHNFWEKAYSDSFYASQKAQIPPNTDVRKTEITQSITPIVSTKFQPTPSAQEVIKEPEKKITKPDEKLIKGPQTIPSTLPEPKEQIEEMKRKLQQELELKVTSPQEAGDETGILINNAFNDLIRNLNNMKGHDFSIELQKIADFVLEKRGFSVTLHKLRSLINKYRFNEFLLSEKDINQIIENIEMWKRKLI
ncbi:MAG: hypothetical protein ACFFCI_08240 [Promethearchaeota archaeon]